MKLILFFLLSLLVHISCLADSNRVASGTKWTHSWSEGEDASSTFYYFIEDRGRVTRIRVMWNGGCQNKPTVTDYLFVSDSIRILSQEASRENIPELILGKDTGLKLLAEFKILRNSAGRMLVPEPPRKALNDRERMYLKEILDLLLQNREQYKIDAEQGGVEQSATASQSKSKGSEKTKPAPKVYSE